jgi:DNA-binding CsgD family transcriptional regulator
MQRGFLDNLARTPNVIGFAAHWAWIWCTFWSVLFYRENAYLEGFSRELWFSLEPLWTLSLLSNVIGLGLLLLLSYFRGPLNEVRALPIVAALCTAVGTLLISHPAITLLGAVAGPIYPLGAVLTGLGSAVVVVLWGEALTLLGARYVISYSVVALLIGAVAYFGITSIPLEFAQLVAALLPFVSVYFLLRLKREMPRRGLKPRKVPLATRPPFRLIGISLFFGASFGIMKGLFVMNEGDNVELRDLLNIIAIVLGSIAIYASMKTFRMDFDHLTYQIALPLMAAGFLFLPLHDPFNIIGTAVHQFGYQYFYIVLWALWPVLARCGDVPGGWIVCWGMVSIQLGQFAGSLLSAGLTAGGSGGVGEAAGLITSDFDLAMLAAIAIFVILLISLFGLGNSSADTGWGFLKPIEDAEQRSPFEQACMRMARACGLTHRESEVFLLLARGRNRAYISEDLVISDETAKSHIKNIYRKTGVHSQQEMIDLIEIDGRATH